MPLRPRGPWFRKGRGWYVKLRGKQIPLGITDRRRRDLAEEKYHELMLAQGVDRPAVEGKVAGVLSLFVDHLEQSATATTATWYTRYIEKFSAEYAGMAVVDLRPHHVQSWLAKYFTGKSHRQPITAIKRAFAWAVEAGHIERSPVSSVKRPPAKRRENVLSAEQRETIHAAIESQAVIDLVTALEQTGARVEEIRTVEARHFSRELSAWVFPPSEHKTGNRTGQPRIIPLPAAMLAIVARLNEKRTTGPIFRNTRGEPWTSNAIRCQFRRLRKRAKGLPPNLCGTHFRHTLATDMVAAGTNLDVIRRVLGHSSFEMLAKHYLHAQDVQLLRDAVTASRGDGPKARQAKGRESAAKNESIRPASPRGKTPKQDERHR